MRYFYSVNVHGNKENTISFYVLSELIEPKAKDFAEEMNAAKIKANPVYAEFVKGKKFKNIMANFRVFQTDSDLTKIKPEEIEKHLQSLVDNKQAAHITSSEFEVTAKAVVKSKVKAKMAKITTEMKLILAGICLACLFIGVAVGTFFFGGSGGGIINNTANNPDLEYDGLIMPETAEFSPNADLLTISIDRSYSPVPKEDIQINGELINGVATITLPHFSREEYFSHVSGYTWGFTSDPNGEKIEYYGGVAYSFTQNVKLYRVLVKYGGGNGTKDDPYLINYYDQLELMAQEKARGYFRQTADLTFPAWASHTPINTVNELKLTPQAEYFEYDGGGYMIDGLNAPLFGRVSGSVIKNVNITNANINTTKQENIGFIVSEAFNYRYEADGVTYETGETLIKNSTVSRSAINAHHPAFDADGNPIPQTVPPAESSPPPVIPPDMELTDEQIETLYNIPVAKHGEFAIGGISGLGGQIENCYVTDVRIYAGLNNYFLYAGGISGKPANVINSGVNFLTIEGNIFHAGGIAGSAGGSRLYKADGSELPVYYGGNIQGCFVRSFSGYSETSAGGIAGEGGTNAKDSLISNNYATGLHLVAGIFEDEARTKIIKLGRNGGIMGTDGNDNNGHLIINTVSDSYYNVIGSVRNSRIDDTVRLAPAYAFEQIGILDIINRNTVTPDNLGGDSRPNVIFTGSFMFADDERNSNDGGAYPFPAEIAELFIKTQIVTEE